MSVQGVYIYDENGKRYLDATGGANASIPIGHGVNEIASALYSFFRAVIGLRVDALQAG